MDELKEVATMDELLIIVSKKAWIMDENGTSSKIESLISSRPMPLKI
jgi:hypothetical protein